MIDDKWPFPEQRVAGVQEHYERVQMFLKLASESEDPIEIFRLQIAGIYFARGIIELIFEAADKEQLSVSREQLKKTLPEKLQWYNLIERIRIHDFHRFGLIPPDPNKKVFFQGGPIELHARKGRATYTIQSNGPKTEVTGNSCVKKKRPLISTDGRFYDDEENKYVSIEQILNDFLRNVSAVIEEFEKNLKGKDNNIEHPEKST